MKTEKNIIMASSVHLLLCARYLALLNTSKKEKQTHRYRNKLVVTSGEREVGGGVR